MFHAKETIMDLQHKRDELNPHYEECLRLSHCWLWFLILGIATVALGVAAIGSAFIATLTAVKVFGIFLSIAGVVQIVNAFLARTWKAFFLHVLIGILHLIVGEIMIEHPLMAAEALTLMLTVAFLVGGACRLVYGATQSFSGRGWVLVNGLVTLLLGISIWRQWPESSLWVIGLFIGVDLVFSGWSWVMLGLAVKPGARPADHRENQPLAAAK
jgi:uncharacterized membrane protein HdeD (DUF308 family)